MPRGKRRRRPARHMDDDFLPEKLEVPQGLRCGADVLRGPAGKAKFACRLSLNLEMELELKVHIHGTVQLELL